MLIYLSGSIDYGGVSQYDSTHLWRERARYLLGGNNCIDPTRREYSGELSDETIRKLVTDDLDDIEKCDVLLANVWKFSPGTQMEMWYSYYDLSIPVITVCPKELRKAWIRYVSEAIFDTIDEACEHIKINYLKV